MKARRRAAPRYKKRRAPLRGRKAPMRGPRMRRKKATGQKRRRIKAPVIPLAPRGSPPSYFELLQEAVLILKEAGKGASMPEIRRQLQKKYKGRFDKAGNKLLTTALQRLAERGKVIRKKGYKYTFNAPKVSNPKPASASSSAYSGTSRSGATIGSAPTESDATAGRNVDDSRTSASSSSSGTNRSGKSAKDEAPKDEAPKDDSPENVDDEDKSSSGDLSSSAPSASSTASRRPSSKRR